MNRKQRKSWISALVFIMTHSFDLLTLGLRYGLELLLAICSFGLPWLPLAVKWRREQAQRLQGHSVEIEVIDDGGYSVVE